MHRSTIFLSLGVGLALMAAAAFSVLASDMAYVAYVMRCIPTVYPVVMAAAFLVFATATWMQFGDRSLAAYQFALSIILTVRDAAYRARAVQRQAFERRVYMTTATA